MKLLSECAFDTRYAKDLFSLNGAHTCDVNDSKATHTIITELNQQVPLGV